MSKMRQPRPLNAGQRAFAEAYVRDGGAAWKAAWKAGYSNINPNREPTAHKKAALRSEASRLRKHPRVAAYIEQLQHEARRAKPVLLREFCSDNHPKIFAAVEQLQHESRHAPIEPALLRVLSNHVDATQVGAAFGHGVGAFVRFMGGALRGLAAG